MRAVAQRVSSASVEVNGKVAGEIGPGLLVLLGIAREDGEKEAAYLAGKVAGLRIFHDDEGKMNRSVVDAGGRVLVVSNFTLCGDARRGRRPSFGRAAPPEAAEPLYLKFMSLLRELGAPTEGGVFGATMRVALVNDGPVTILLDSEKIF